MIPRVRYHNEIIGLHPAYYLGVSFACNLMFDMLYCKRNVSRIIFRAASYYVKCLSLTNFTRTMGNDMFRRLSRSNQPGRPYQAFRIEDLNVATTIAWNSSNALQEIIHELIHRKTKRAVALQRRVESRISDLSGSGSARTFDETLFAQVGLHPSAPDFLIQAAIKAYRDNGRSSRTPEGFRKIEQIINEIGRR